MELFFGSVLEHTCQKNFLMFLHGSLQLLHVNLQLLYGNLALLHGNLPVTDCLAFLHGNLPKVFSCGFPVPFVHGLGHSTNFSGVPGFIISSRLIVMFRM